MTVALLFVTTPPRTFVTIIAAFVLSGVNNTVELVSFLLVHYSCENLLCRSPTVRDPRFGSWSNRDLLVRRLFGRNAHPLGGNDKNGGSMGFIMNTLLKLSGASNFRYYIIGNFNEIESNIVKLIVSPTDNDVLVIQVVSYEVFI
jgi:hypothetical protein